MAVRPLPGETATCEVVVAGDLQAGMRKYWRWSAATSAGASAAGGAAGVGLGASAVAGALLIVPAALGAAIIGGAFVGAWVLGTRYYRSAVEECSRRACNSSRQRFEPSLRVGARFYRSGFRGHRLTGARWIPIPNNRKWRAAAALLPWCRLSG